MNKKLIILILGLVIVFGVGVYLLIHREKPIGAVTYDTLNWKKPTTDAEWAEDVKGNMFNIRLDYQLQEIKVSLENKIVRAQQPLLEKATLYPDVIRYEYFKLGIKEPELTEEVNKTISQYKLDYEIMAQAIERVNKEIELRKNGKVDRTADILSTHPTTEQEKAEINKLKSIKGL